MQSYISVDAMRLFKPVYVASSHSVVSYLYNICVCVCMRAYVCTCVRVYMRDLWLGSC